ncbi:MAG: 2-oxoacid:acceptor oxidoreductase family protein [Candidatus Bathyarchaeia archaeon]
MTDTWTVRFGGFGGQGIVLSSVILGLAATYDGKYACQTASYGAEARGGKCKSEVIISNEEIIYPIIDQPKVLVIMSQQALDSYLDDLESDGLLIVDPDMTRDFDKRKDVEITKIPATRVADKLGNRIVANMIMLGALQAKTGLVSEESLRRAILASVPQRFVEINLKALEKGAKLVRSESYENQAGGD